MSASATGYFDNKTQLFKDKLVREVRSHDRVAVADLVAVWVSLCTRVAYGDACGEGFDERMARDAEASALEKEIEQINKKRRSERQVAKRSALFQRLRAAQARLAELKESC